MDPKWPKHKKPFISASKRARTVLNTFLECMYCVDVTDVAYMTDVRVRHFRHIPKIPVYFRHFRHIPKIPVYFRTGVSNLIFGKIFGKFREIFGRSKPLFCFGPLLDFENF